MKKKLGENWQIISKNGIIIMPKNSLLLEPDFPEDIVAIMLQMYLTIVSFPRGPFCIIPFSKKEERYLGADAKIVSIRPLYLQFKRSLAYPDYSTSIIIKDRNNLNLPTSTKTFFFELRNLNNGQSDYQHNILFRLRQKLLSRKLGDACYVAPLFLERKHYIWHMYFSGIHDWFPFFFRRYPFQLVDLDLFDHNGTIRIGKIPSLREHVSIPPHSKVSTYKHKYSYTENGTHVCFHSPERIEDGTMLFSEFLKSFLRINQERGTPEANMIHLSESKSILNDLIDSTNLNEPMKDYLQDESLLSSWLFFGDLLNSYYKIEQYALINYEIK